MKSVSIKTICKVGGVARKIPGTVVAKELPGLHYVVNETEEFYYHLGLPVGNGRMLNIHFFGIGHDELGKTHTFDAEVWEKTVTIEDETEKYTGLNLRKSSGKARFNLKFDLSGRASGGIGIIGSACSIIFEKREEKIAAPVAA